MVSTATLRQGVHHYQPAGIQVQAPCWPVLVKGRQGPQYFLSCLAQMKLLFPKNFLYGSKGLFPGPSVRENRVLWENSVLIAISNFFFKNYFLIEI